MKVLKVRSELLKWYGLNKRNLPWRKSKDPYRIWISEIMLQQTRVETVIPYYERFLSNFPTVQDLASADIDKLLNLWAGLGYYSRARNLKAAAEQIVSEFNGNFPENFLDLRSLKGIGPYTASAIASIAFDQRLAAIDGNLERVFSRLLALKKNPKLEGKAEIEKFGAELVSSGEAGDINQAVMDLASKICLPKIPKCNECPLTNSCIANEKKLQNEIPLKKKKTPPIELQARGLIIIHKEKLLLARRAKGSWLSGMWDIPWWIENPTNKKYSVNQLGESFSMCAQTRTITKHKIHFEVTAIKNQKMPSENTLKKIPAGAQEFKWVALEDLHGVNLPRPSEKALEQSLAELE